VLVLDSIQPEKWYSVKEVAAVLGFSEDTVARQINRGFLKAFVLPGKSDKRRRVYRCRRIQGAEIIRYIKTFLNRN
jgi:AraC-like DNA-binding protein